MGSVKKMKSQIQTKLFAFISLFIFGLISLLLCAGCEPAHRRSLFEDSLDKPLVWPDPPERPRIKYIGSISTEADLKKKLSWSQGLTSLIFGKKDIGVLLCPYAVAADPDNRVFVADVSAAALHIFDLNTREYKQISDTGEREKLMNPVGLALVDDEIYIVDSQLRKVFVFDKEGRYKFSFGHGQLERPSGIAYSPNEDLIYVSDSAQHVINIFRRNGKLMLQFGSRGAGDGMFNFPTHLWVDAQGQLYVSDTLNYRIQIFTSEGKFVRMFGSQGDRPGFFAHPCGVATDSFGHIYVTDRQFENVQIFDSIGRLLMVLGSEGSEPGSFWLPAGIFIDKQNKIFVADSFNKRIQIFEFLGDSKP